MPPMNKRSWMIAVAVALAVALVACSKKSDDAGKGGAAGGGDAAACADAIAKGVSSLSGGPEAAGVKDKLQAIYSKHCTENKWSDEVLRCFETASGMTGLRTCRGKLPPDQASKLQAEIMGAMTGGMGGMGGMGSMGGMGGMMGRPPMGPGSAGAPDGSAAGAPGAPGTPATPDGSATAPPPKK
jgi:hypothetical protein